MSCATLDRLLHAAGHRLVALPTLGTTAAETADELTLHLAEGRIDAAIRDVLQLADDLAREHGAVRVALVTAPPAPTGDDRFDAFVAGLVAYRLGQERLPIPAWVRAARPLPTPWFVDPYHADESSVDDTPPALRRLGVIIDEHDLRSV